MAIALVFGMSVATGCDAVADSSASEATSEQYNEVRWASTLGDDGEVTRRFYRDFLLRYVHRWEMHHLLVLSGFEVQDLFGDFNGSPFDETSTEMVWVARMRA